LIRITGGIFKGRLLDVPNAARPSTDRVREALFSILASRMSFEEASVLDIFCGSGSLGLEAVSRGAEFAVFVDSDKGSVKAAQTNIDRLELEGSTVIHSPVGKFLEHQQVSVKGDKNRRFSLVFADPPYSELNLVDLMSKLKASSCLADQALVVIESALELEKVTLKGPGEIDNFELLVDRTYGQSRIRLFRSN
jgi:16S rRNA (guanine966-N2)-methyltransferase